MFKTEVENSDFCKSLYYFFFFNLKKLSASGCWHYIKSIVNKKVDTGKKYGLRALASALIHIFFSLPLH